MIYHGNPVEPHTASHAASYLRQAQAIAAVTFVHELAMGSYKPDEIEARAKAIARMTPLDVQPIVQDHEDAERWREVAERFDQAKASACERILEGLGLGGEDATKAFETIIDAARAKEQ